MTRLLPWLALAAVGFLAWLGVQRHIAGDAVLGERIRARETVIAGMAQTLAGVQGRIPAVDTVLTKDTTATFAWARRYQRLRDSLRTVPDSGTTVPNMGTPILVAADSTIASCDRALHSCDAAIAVRDTALAQAGGLLAQKDSLLADVRKRSRGFRFLGIPLACVGGGVTIFYSTGPGIGCGVPLLK